MKKRNQIVSHTDFENIKKNIALLEIEGTTKQKNIIRHDDIRKQLNRSFLYRSEARKIAKKLDIDYIILCQMPARSVDSILKEEQKQKFRLSNNTEDESQKSGKEEMEGKMEKLNNMESTESTENIEITEKTETVENTEKAENKETAENSAIRKIDIFKKITGKSARYVCTQLGFSPSSLSLLKRGIKLSVVEEKINKTMPFIFEGCSYEDSDPQKIIEMFEKNAEKVRKDQPKKTRQTKQTKRAKTAKTNKKAEMQEKGVKTEKAGKTEKEEKTNLEYYQTRIIETANEFMSNGKMTAARATTNALKSIIPDSADSPEKVLNWLNGKHEDKYFLSDVEEAMLSGYFKMHKNALITVFADTYMYESKVESGLFKGIPANITLEYLRDHSVKKGSEKNG